MPPTESVQISSRDYCVKVVGMLQQNWAIADADPGGGCIVWFIDDGSGVFDQMPFSSQATAAEALARNGFTRYAADPELQAFLHPPAPPFVRRAQSNGAIYSSGRSWT